tara:strand:+ start:335 stop:583 length:249 start_codon:yes stop_codon:yes gene_type:complete
MRLTKQQLLKLIYEQQVQDVSSPAEVEPEEDVWGTGEALEDKVDYEDAADIPSNVQEPEVMEIVEKVRRRIALKKIIRENTK